nr:MAG TPA: hypothetical protein [Caudoviricetes sp.]
MTQVYYSPILRLEASIRELHDVNLHSPLGRSWCYVSPIFVRRLCHIHINACCGVIVAATSTA